MNILGLCFGAFLLTVLGHRIGHWKWTLTASVTMMVVFGALLALGNPERKGMMIAFVVCNFESPYTFNIMLNPIPVPLPSRLRLGPIPLHRIHPIRRSPSRTRYLRWSRRRGSFRWRRSRYLRYIYTAPLPLPPAQLTTPTHSIHHNPHQRANHPSRQTRPYRRNIRRPPRLLRPCAPRRAAPRRHRARSRPRHHNGDHGRCRRGVPTSICCGSAHYGAELVEFWRVSDYCVLLL